MHIYTTCYLPFFDRDTATASLDSLEIELDGVYGDAVASVEFSADR
jgi:hypothetical protein